jgi:hypothetical protein
LAWNLQENCAILAHSLKEILDTDEFVSKHKSSPLHFTRNRILTFATVFLIIINFRKSAIQTELDSFFKAINNKEVPDPKVSDSAFCQARMKLKHTAFIELDHYQVSYFYDHFSYRTWLDYRLLAIDGTTFQVGNNKELAAHFNGMSFSDDVECSMARSSQLYDVLNKVTIDATLKPYSLGEREISIQHTNHLSHKDIALLDRGYSAFWSFALIRSKHAHFCARMSIDQWKIVKEFYASGKKERVISLIPSKSSFKKCQELGISCAPLRVRLIRIEFENGNVEILMTSLIDTNTFPYEVFSDLYHQRWNIEERIKAMKCRIQMENFSGKSVETVYQDFYAKIFSMNLTSILTHPVQDDITKEDSNKKHSYQINFTRALSCMKDTIVLLFIRPYRIKLIQQLFVLFKRKIEPIRPNRKYPRKRVIRDHQIYPIPYKQTR